jgi:hypothetical protein
MGDDRSSTRRFALVNAKLVAAGLCLALSAAAPAIAAEAPPIFVGGSFIRQHAIDDGHGHVLVPVRGVFEALHAEVSYTPPRYVVVRKDGSVVAGLIIGRTHALVGNRPRMLPVAPQRRDGRLYVPLRVIAEIAGADVRYSANPRLVDIRLPYRAPAVAADVDRDNDDSANDGIPLWCFALVGFAGLALIIELGRQISIVVRVRARRSSIVMLPPHLRALPPRALQLPNASDPRNEIGMGQIRKQPRVDDAVNRA